MPTRLAPTILISPNPQQFPQQHGHMEPFMLWHRSSRGPKFHWALKSALAEAREVPKKIGFDAAEKEQQHQVIKKDIGYQVSVDTAQFGCWQRK